MASKSCVTSMNLDPSRIRLARTFLKSFARINSPNSRIATAAATGTPVAPSASELKRRSKRIKMAAYTSMARVAGPRRAWARALLFKLQTRARHGSLMGRGRGRRMDGRSNEEQAVGKLRRVVPGGEGMDVCTLLEETADFIHCLSTQVKVMKAVSHHFSTN